MSVEIQNVDLSCFAHKQKNTGWFTRVLQMAVPEGSNAWLVWVGWEMRYSRLTDDTVVWLGDPADAVAPSLPPEPPSSYGGSDDDVMSVRSVSSPVIP